MNTTVQQRLERLLRTTPGERVMRPTYGCNLHELVDKRRDQAWMRDVSHEIYTAISTHEPDIGMQRVQLEASGDQVSACIDLGARTVTIPI